MNIQIKRSSENLVKGVSITLKSHISVTLSDSEISLTQKYYNPAIRDKDIFQFMSNPEIANKLALIRPTESIKARLKDFEIIALTNDGLIYLQQLEDLESAIVKLLQAKINYLFSLDQWPSDKTIRVVDAKYNSTSEISIAELLNEIRQD